MTNNTIHFRKKFNVSSIPTKMQIAEQLQQLCKNCTRLDGTEMSEEELKEMRELLTWCHDNTFYNKLPSDRFNTLAPDRAKNLHQGQPA